MIYYILGVIWLISIAGYIYQKKELKMSFESFKKRWESKGYTVKGTAKNAVIYKIKKHN